MNSLRPREASLPLSIELTSRPPALWVAVSGEVDLANRVQLESALVEVDLTGAESLHLELDGLAFCDIGGCRLLMRLEQRARLSGLTTTIHGANPTMHAVMRLMTSGSGPDFVPRQRRA